MTGVMQGVKVVEMATYNAGPTAARILGDWGADVVKIENYHGDTLRPLGMNLLAPIDDDENPVFFMANSNKKIIALNIKTQEGLDIAHKLISEADVFITNTRTDALKRVGLDYDTLSLKYPRLIFGHILGYGEEGPLKDRPAFDFSTYFARSSFMSTMADKNGPPTSNAPAFGDHQLALAIAGGIGAALYGREKTGRGDYVHASLYHMGIYGFALLMVSDYYEASYPITHDEPLSPLVTVYKSKDDKWFYIASPDYLTYFPKVCDVLGLEELKNDERYNDIVGMLTNSVEIKRQLQEAIIKFDVDELVTMFLDGNIPSEKVFTIPDVRNDAQVWANDFMVEVEYKNGSKGQMVTSPIRLKSMGKGFDYQRIPGGLGAESADVLRDMGYSDADIQKLKEIGAVNFGD